MEDKTLPDNNIPDDFSLAGYHFELPEELIAQFPSSERGGSRLYVLHRNADNAPDAPDTPGAFSAPVASVAPDVSAVLAVPTVLEAPSAPAGCAGQADGDTLAVFSQLPEFLPPKCLFVANNSRVIPARLHGKRAGGGKFELLLLTPLPIIESESRVVEPGSQMVETMAATAPESGNICDQASVEIPEQAPDVASGHGSGHYSGEVSDDVSGMTSAQATEQSSGQMSGREFAQASEESSAGVDSKDWRESRATVLLRPAKKLKIGETYRLGEEAGFCCTILEKGEFGQAEVMLQWQGSLLDRIFACGSLPLPPYIRREAEAGDMERYQTTFCDASKAGSVAAPTAGLHFTPQMRQSLQEQGHEWAELTLFVGYGTFSPVRTQDIRQHQMHPEYVEISAETIEKIQRAKREGRPVIAVGTTSTRVLEGLAEQAALAQASGKKRADGNHDIAMKADGTLAPSDAPDAAGSSDAPPAPGGSSATARKINSAPAASGALDTSCSANASIIAGIADMPGGAELLKPYAGWLNCFIYPGKPVRVIDGLLTNFHLPESTLLMLVSTLCGRERLLSAYNRAVREKFRFFSYGDAMLIL